MRYPRAILLLAFLALGVGGCWLDGPTGMVKNEDGSVTYDPSKDVVGGTLKAARDATSGTPVGGILSVILAGLGGWQWLRARSNGKALAVTVEGVEAFLNTTPGKVVADEFKKWLATRHEVAGVMKTIEPLVDKFGHTQ